MPEKLKSPKGKKSKTKVKASDLGASTDDVNKEEKKKKKDEEKKNKSKKKKKDSSSKKTSTKTTKSSSSGKTKKKKATDAMMREAGLDLSICRICNDPEVNACTRGSNCDHVFCISCLEDHLSKPMKNPTINDAHLGCPTLGRCPVCNVELKLFDVRNIDGSDDKFYGRYCDIQTTPIAGKIFTPRSSNEFGGDGSSDNGDGGKKSNKLQQFGNFHFDIDYKKVDKQGRVLPYIDFTNVIELDQEKWLLNDGSQINKRIYFEEGCHFHERTHTFHGIIKFNNNIRFHGAYQWDITLAFNSGYSAINVGVIHKRTERLVEPRDDIDKDDAYRYLYPCDGKWKLLWLDQTGNPRTGAITVRGNEFQQGPYVFHINFADPQKPGFRWPLDPVYATAKSGFNLIDQPLGPGIGDKIEWETTHPAFPEIMWVRETIGLPPAPDTTHFGQGTENHYTSTHSAVESTMYEAFDVSMSQVEDVSSSHYDDDNYDDDDDDDDDSSSDDE